MWRKIIVSLTVSVKLLGTYTSLLSTCSNENFVIKFRRKRSDLKLSFRSFQFSFSWQPEIRACVAATRRRGNRIDLYVIRLFAVFLLSFARRSFSPVAKNRSKSLRKTTTRLFPFPLGVTDEGEMKFGCLDENYTTTYLSRKKLGSEISVSSASSINFLPSAPRIHVECFPILNID